MAKALKDEINSQYYERYEKTNILLAKAEEDVVIFKYGLEALERRLMKKHDDDFRANNNGKALPEYLQRREAKADPQYMSAVRALAKASSLKTLYRGQLAKMDKEFDEWRTRSADRRGSL